MAINFDADSFTVTRVGADIQVELGNSDGNLAAGSAWNGPHLVLGTYHLWVDATGDLRIDTAAPTSDTDGVVVGSQS